MAQLTAGTMVEVVHAAGCYPRYEEMAQWLGLTKFRPAPYNTTLQNGDVGHVLGSRMHHQYDTVIVVGIHVPDRQQDYLISGNNLKVVQAPPAPPPPRPPPPQAAIMETLWASRAETGDVRMKAADGQAIVAHACILSATSPVFASALTSGMKETATKEIELPDTEFDIVQGVMEFLYLGVLPASTDRIAMAQFAHKYSIEAVAMSLAGDLINMINEENAASIVRLLRDFDKDGGNLMKRVIEAVGNDQAILMQLLLQL